ncbi:MAG: dihydrofolate reductase family protein [Gammaproteobacteria bacterium]|nr:dihydrofolate reductase family protein [Gammaproteobacteria bacterium]
MTAKILPLYPDPGPEQALTGLYLRQRLFEIGSVDKPFVYANFVTSLDGRIALIEPGNGKSYLPEGLGGGNDFRLFQELHAQADCLITHAGYLRALSLGRLGNILQVDDSGDLVEWRLDNGLSKQPAVVVASASLDFTVPDSIAAHGQTLYIVTGQAADRARVRALQAHGLKVIFAGADRSVAGAPLTDALGRLGYRCLYLIAGPRMLDTMLRARRMARLYLTISHRLLGGEHFHSMIEGAPLGTAGGLRLRSLYYDRGASDGFGQWFAQFDPTDV